MVTWSGWSCSRSSSTVATTDAAEALLPVV